MPCFTLPRSMPKQHTGQPRTHPGPKHAQTRGNSGWFSLQLVRMRFVMASPWHSFGVSRNARLGASRLHTSAHAAAAGTAKTLTAAIHVD